MAEQKSNNNTIMDVRDQFLLPVSRIAFHDLFVPKAFQEGQKPKYGVTLLFDPLETFDSYKAAVERLKKHPDFSKLAVMPGSPEEAQRLAMGLTKEDIVYADEFLKGLSKAIKKETNIETLEKYPFMKGQFKCTANAYFPPAILDAAKNKIPVEQKELIYSGCYGQALVSVGIHNKDKIFLRLHAFQKQKNGEPLGRASANLDSFKTFAEDEVGNSLAEEEDSV
jgi:hypothetical protein